MIEGLIRRRFGGYRHRLDPAREDLPVRLASRRAVAVVGGGLAGLAAASYLSERGFQVSLFERNSYLGGKVGSWPVELDGWQTRVEHGFHAFFRQYYNLRGLLEKWGSSRHLIPIEDYRILTLRHGEFGFRGIKTAPLLNMLSLAKTGLYRMGELMRNPRSGRLLDLLRYDADRTFARYDGTSFRQFADAAGLPPAMRLMFNTFSRAFFAEAHLMSMAEMIKSFHLYFLSNDLGLLYDVLNDDFETTLLAPARRFLEAQGAGIHTGREVARVGRGEDGTGFVVEGKRYDYLVLAADVKAIPGLARQSGFIREESPVLQDRLTGLKSSQRYAVLRLWLDRGADRDLPFFLFTDRLKLLDSISLYHKMEHGSRRWAEENRGGVFELHSYAVPDEVPGEAEVRAGLLEELFAYLPELKGARILHEYLQLRDDFTAFHTGLAANRPGWKTEIPGLYLAGDWVKLPTPAMLMEASCTSALLAANDILQREGLRSEPLYSVPLKGFLA